MKLTAAQRRVLETYAPFSDWRRSLRGMGLNGGAIDAARRRGLLDYTVSHSGVAYYRITPEGRTALSRPESEPTDRGETG